MLKVLVPIVLLVPLNALAASAPCEGIQPIEDRVTCLQAEVAKAEASMAQYLGLIRERHAAGLVPKVSLRSIESSQEEWMKTRFAHCRAVGLIPRDEAKIAAQNLYCQYEVVRGRTHELWEKHLSPSAQVLPELSEMPDRKR